MNKTTLLAITLLCLGMAGCATPRYIPQSTVAIPVQVDAFTVNDDYALIPGRILDKMHECDSRQWTDRAFVNSGGRLDGDYIIINQRSEVLLKAHIDPMEDGKSRVMVYAPQDDDSWGDVLAIIRHAAINGPGCPKK